MALCDVTVQYSSKIAPHNSQLRRWQEVDRVEHNMLKFHPIQSELGKGVGAQALPADVSDDTTNSHLHWLGNALKGHSPAAPSVRLQLCNSNWTPSSGSKFDTTCFYHTKLWLLEQLTVIPSTSQHAWASPQALWEPAVEDCFQPLTAS